MLGSGAPLGTALPLDTVKATNPKMAATFDIFAGTNYLTRGLKARRFYSGEGPIARKTLIPQPEDFL